MQLKDSIYLISRYIFLVLIALPGIQLFYLVFTPLTVYPAYWILRLLYPSILIMSDFLLLSSLAVQLIPACIAGSAYYLLLILNMTTPMPVSKRLKSLGFIILSFLFLNILRLVIFSILFFNGYQYFGVMHSFIWYFGSTALVVIIWFANAWVFKIKGIPAYTDMKSLFSGAKKRGKKR